MTATAPRRVRVTHPRTEAARRGPVRARQPGFDGQAPVDAVYLSALIRTQRRLAILVCSSVAAILGGAALLGGLSPHLTRVRWLGVPLPWLGLGLLIYPVLILIAVWAVRQAERNETAFSELIGRRARR